MPYSHISTTLPLFKNISVCSKAPAPISKTLSNFNSKNLFNIFSPRRFSLSNDPNNPERSFSIVPNSASINLLFIEEDVYFKL